MRLTVAANSAPRAKAALRAENGLPLALTSLSPRFNQHTECIIIAPYPDYKWHADAKGYCSVQRFSAGLERVEVIEDAVLDMAVGQELLDGCVRI